MSPRLELIGGLIMLVATLVYAIEPERVVISGDDAVPVRMASPTLTTPMIGDPVRTYYTPANPSTISYATTGQAMMPVYAPCGISTAGASSVCTTMVPVSR